MVAGLPDFHSPIDVALQSLNAQSIDIIAQTIATVKNDYRFGTASVATGSDAAISFPETLISLTGKGIIFSGRWSHKGTNSDGLVNSTNAWTYEIDGDDHDFENFTTILAENLATPQVYHPTIEAIDVESGDLAGYLPGPVTFESSFKVIYRATGSPNNTQGTVSVTIFYAAALT